MATTLRLGPADHNRPMTLEEFLSSDYEEGHRYELIDGRLYAAPMPDCPHSWMNKAAYRKLDDYSRVRPGIVNYVVTDARVFVQGKRATAPEPDISCYRDFPIDSLPGVNWRNVSPILVVEVLGGEDEQKDLVRNVDLYWRVTSIEEYWVIDIRGDASRPALRVYRRDSDAWQVLDIPFGAAYQTALLPDFSWRVDPRSRT